MSTVELKDDPWRLHICWYEIEKDSKERLQRCCGELLGSVHKMNFVRLELEEAVEKDDLDAAYDYTDYHIENYLTRLYALRERVLAALQLLTGIKSEILKNPKDRQNAIPQFREVAPQATAIIVDLLGIIDDDIKTRNTDTHEAFFKILLYVNNRVWEPTDVLMEAKGTTEGPEVEVRLRTILHCFVEVHCKRIDEIIEKTQEFVQVVRSQ